MVAPRRRKLQIIWLIATLAATSALHAEADKRAARKALDDAFATLDQLTGTEADPPASARWRRIARVMVLDPRSGNDVRLAAWTTKGSLKRSFGLADGDSSAPCAIARKRARYRVDGVWLSFDVVCRGGARVLAPHSASDRRRMKSSIWAGASLGVESVRGRKAEFDLRGVALADAILSVMAAGDLVPKDVEKSSVPPAIL